MSIGGRRTEGRRRLKKMELSRNEHAAMTSLDVQLVKDTLSRSNQRDEGNRQKTFEEIVNILNFIFNQLHILQSANDEPTMLPID